MKTFAFVSSPSLTDTDINSSCDCVCTALQYHQDSPILHVIDDGKELTRCNVDSALRDFADWNIDQVKSLWPLPAEVITCRHTYEPAAFHAAMVHVAKWIEDHLGRPYKEDMQYDENTSPECRAAIAVMFALRAMAVTGHRAVAVSVAQCMRFAAAAFDYDATRVQHQLLCAAQEQELRNCINKHYSLGL